MEVPKKKKRGRKPKNKIVINDNPVFENKDKVDNLIACISSKKIKYENKNLLSDLKEINETEKDYSFISDNKDTIQTQNRSCWNCCCDIKTIISLPIKYNKEVFYTNGDFCTFECAGRYLLDNYNIVLK